MNPTHIHLVITHLPIFGSILGAFVLAYGLMSKSNETKIAAYYLFVISSIGAGIAYLTGEEAEETAENIQGISENMIEQHEDFAVFALTGLIILGIASLAGIFFTKRKAAFTGTIALIVLLISLISFGLVARTGYLGGQIRHTEISTSPGAQQQSVKHEDND